MFAKDLNLHLLYVARKIRNQNIFKGGGEAVEISMLSWKIYIFKLFGFFSYIFLKIDSLNFDTTWIKPSHGKKIEKK